MNQGAVTGRTNRAARASKQLDRPLLPAIRRQVLLHLGWIRCLRIRLELRTGEFQGTCALSRCSEDALMPRSIIDKYMAVFRDLSSPVRLVVRYSDRSSTVRDGSQGERCERSKIVLRSPALGCATSA